MPIDLNSPEPAPAELNRAGAIEERGTHASLLARNGLYARMWAMQADEPATVPA